MFRRARPAMMQRDSDHLITSSPSRFTAKLRAGSKLRYDINTSTHQHINTSLSGSRVTLRAGSKLRYDISLAPIISPIGALIVAEGFSPQRQYDPPGLWSPKCLTLASFVPSSFPPFIPKRSSHPIISSIEALIVAEGFSLQRQQNLPLH